jgi:hypothetical protein
MKRIEKKSEEEGNIPFEDLQEMRNFAPHP